MTICSKQQFFPLVGSKDYYLILNEIQKNPHVPSQRTDHIPSTTKRNTYCLQIPCSKPSISKCTCTVLLYSCKRIGRNMYCNFPNGNFARCHYGHTISTRREAIQEFTTSHTHPLTPTFTSRMTAGQCQHRLAGTVCLTRPLRDLA